MANTITANNIRLKTESKTPETNVGETERWVSVVSGGLLILTGLKHPRSLTGWSVIALGAGMLHRGLTGHCKVYRALNVNSHTIDDEGVHVQAAVTINRPAEELYRYWRQLENLPGIMSHLESVTELDAKRSHWVAKAPAGTSVSWDAEIVSETENQTILWRSLEGAQISNAGSVRFVPVPGDRGTEVHVSLSYSPPGGSVGVAVAKLFGEEPQQQVREDLLHFKQLMEAGEIPTTKGQSSGKSLKRTLKSNMLSSAVSRQGNGAEPFTGEKRFAESS